MVQAGPHYLMIRRAAGRPAPGYWTPITGKLEPDETLPDAAIREVREETGLDVVLTSPELQRTLTSNGDFELVWFRAAPKVHEAPLRLAADEVAEACWLTRDEVLGLAPLFATTRAWFEAEPPTSPHRNIENS